MCVEGEGSYSLDVLLRKLGAAERQGDGYTVHSVCRSRIFLRQSNIKKSF